MSEGAGAAPDIRRAVFLAVGASMLWAAGIVLVKAGLAGREDAGALPPLTFASLRYLVGAATLWAWRTIRSNRTRHDTSSAKAPVGWLIALGLTLYAFVPAVQFLAIDRLEAVTFNFIFQAGIPLVLAATAGFVLKEATSRSEWFGVAIVVAGIYVFNPAFSDDATTATASGIALAVAAAVGIGASNLIQRQVMRRGTVRSLDATLGPMALGSVTLLLYALMVETFPRLDPWQVSLIAILGVINTALAFTMWHEAMRTLNALHAGIIASAQIVEVPILAWLILDERMTTARVVGSVVVLVGIVIVHVSKAAAAQRQRMPVTSPRP